MRRFWLGLVAMALVAAACGDDATDGADEADDAGDDTVEAGTSDDGTGSTGAADGAAADAGTDGSVDADEGDGDDVDGAAADDDQGIELTASYRGVTAESITIGLAMVDLDKINEAFGFDFTATPVEEMHLAWADTLNQAGGINGRDVLIEYRGMQPVGSEDSDRICLELMADEEVFVVIGQFLQDAMLCITQLNGHPYVGHFGETPERQERSDGLLFATEIAQVDQRGGGTQAMIDAGDFEGKKVAVVWESDADRVYFDTVDPILDAAGVDVVAELEVNAFTTDTINNEQAWNIAMEQIRLAKADIILNLSNITSVLDAVERTGASQTVAHTNGQAADGAMVLDESIAEDDVLSNSFAVTTWKPDVEESLADPEVQRCIAEFEAAYPDIEIDLADADYVNSFANNCRAFALTVRILEAAGGNITPETFRQAGESLGTFDLPAMVGATLGPDKHSAGSTLSRYEYDPAIAQYVKVGDPIPTR